MAKGSIGAQMSVVPRRQAGVTDRFSLKTFERMKLNERRKKERQKFEALTKRPIDLRPRLQKKDGGIV